MINLNHKTRSDTAPSGKTNVFFSCHPQDYSLYFDSISENILYSNNCCIWYSSEQTIPPDDEFLDTLTQMRLFVFPVTTAFLCTDNYARDILLPFALARHIPILPLVMEPGLEAVFSAKFGDMQFLDATNHDPTQIRYEDKLEKFLSAVLLDDRTQEEIRADFDAHIFLSYRKKDRKHALDLMRKIHSIDFCRDIAIWYDEYLTPGEHFNVSIEDKIKQCDLFALAVTPNLVNEDNYVARKEYPLAQASKKYILPCELIATDPQQLAERFQSIPPCVDAADTEVLSEKLRNSLNQLNKPHKTSRHHTYLMGLAYLTGVDVEEDHQRALELLSSAGEQGHLDAIDMLTFMYSTGSGVHQSSQTAARWQEKHVSHLEKIYAAEEDAQSLHALAQSMIACSTYYKDTGDFAKAIEILHHCQNLIQAFPSYNSFRDLGTDIAACNSCLGDMYFGKGDLIRAEAAYENAHAFYEDAHTRYATLETKRQLCTSLVRLGDIQRIRGDLGKAEHVYRKAVSHATHLMGDSGESADRYAYAFVCGRLSELYLRMQDPISAYMIAWRAYDARNELNAEHNTIESQLNLATSCSFIADSSLDMGDLDTALEFAEKMCEITHSVVEETGALNALRIYGIALNTYGRTLLQMGQPDQAATLHTRAFAVFQRLVELTDAAQYRDDLALTYYDAALAWPEKRQILLQKAGLIYHKLCMDYPDNAEYRNKYDFVLNSM